MGRGVFTLEKHLQGFGQASQRYDLYAWLVNRAAYLKFRNFPCSALQQLIQEGQRVQPAGPGGNQPQIQAVIAQVDRSLTQQ